MQRHTCSHTQKSHLKRQYICKVFCCCCLKMQEKQNDTKKFKNAIESVCVVLLLLGMQPALRVICKTRDIPLEKTNFFISWQISIASGSQMGICVHFLHQDHIQLRYLQALFMLLRLCQIKCVLLYRRPWLLVSCIFFTFIGFCKP